MQLSSVLRLLPLLSLERCSGILLFADTFFNLRCWVTLFSPYSIGDFVVVCTYITFAVPSNNCVELLLFLAP